MDENQIRDEMHLMDELERKTNPLAPANSLFLGSGLIVPVDDADEADDAEDESSSGPGS